MLEKKFRGGVIVFVIKKKKRVFGVTTLLWETQTKRQLGRAGALRVLEVPQQTPRLNGRPIH